MVPKMVDPRKMYLMMAATITFGSAALITFLVWLIGWVL